MLWHCGTRFSSAPESTCINRLESPLIDFECAQLHQYAWPFSSLFHNSDQFRLIVRWRTGKKKACITGMFLCSWLVAFCIPVSRSLWNICAGRWPSFHDEETFLENVVVCCLYLLYVRSFKSLNSFLLNFMFRSKCPEEKWNQNVALTWVTTCLMCLGSIGVLSKRFVLPSAQFCFYS